MNIICVMAIHEREKITTENIRILRKQTIPISNIILVGDSILERRIAEKNNCEYCETSNYPLSNKWQFGISFARQFNPDAILINGSDDFLSPNWCKICSKYLFNEYDVVGVNTRFLCKIDDLKNVKLIKREYIVEKMIGCGKLISRNILDKINWDLFPNNFNKTLDAKIDARMKSAGGKFFIIKDNGLIPLLVKGNWECINPFREEKVLRGVKDIEDIKNPRKWLLKNFQEAVYAIENIYSEISW